MFDLIVVEWLKSKHLAAICFKCLFPFRQPSFWLVLRGHQKENHHVGGSPEKRHTQLERQLGPQLCIRLDYDSALCKQNFSGKPHVWQDQSSGKCFLLGR